MEPLTIYNARVVRDDRVLDPGAVRIRDGEIVAVGPDLAASRRGALLDANRMFLAPGLIEKHVHGGDGADFVDGTWAAFERILRFYASRGVTTIQGTTTAAPPETLAPVLDLARRWQREAVPIGPRLLGIHLEGPFLNVEQCGAQPPAGIQHPSAAVTEELLAYEDVITEITVAPELPGALETIRAASERGILVSAGHSQAREPDVQAAIEAGLRHVTHIFSSMSSLIRRGPWRVPGLLECALAYDELTTEVIADLKHLPPTLIRLVLKCKGPDRVCLVSDAMRGAGMPEGNQFTLGGQVVLIEDGVAQLPDRTAFAGSVTPLDAMVRNLVRELAVPLPDAIRLATTNPARILGIDSWTGRLAPGKKADLILLDDELQVRLTMVGGEIVYQRL